MLQRQADDLLGMSHLPNVERRLLMDFRSALVGELLPAVQKLADLLQSRAGPCHS